MITSQLSRLIEEQQATGHCAGCGAPVLTKPQGRPRKWCSERCRKAQYAGACLDCGKPTSGHAGRAGAPARCQTCGARRSSEASAIAKRAKAEPRYRLIEELWNQGLTMPEIGLQLGVSRGYLSGAMFRMRQRGYNLPYRRMPMVTG